MIEGIRNACICQKRVIGLTSARTRGTIHAGRVAETRLVQLIPEIETGIVLVQVPRDVIGFVVGISEFEKPAPKFTLEMKAVLPGVRTAGVLVVPVVTLAEVG